MSDQTTPFSLNCPLPKFDFDMITLGHGSGGTLTHRLLDAGVFNVLSNPILDEQHDGAILQLDGPIAFSTDSFVVSPHIFPGGTIGELAVNGTVNDLAMCGATPKYLALSFILEEGLDMNEFSLILQQIKLATDKAGVMVVTGDTKVVERGKGDKIFINTTGLGVLNPKAKIHFSNIKAGNKIIVSGQIATHGIAIMSVREGLEFETTIKSDTTNLNHTIHSLIENFGANIHFLRDPTRGGVASVLNEIANQCSLGIEINQLDFSIDNQVEAACEMLGLDPLYVANEGIFVAIVDEHSAQDILSHLKNEENGLHAAIVGEITEDHPRKVIMNSSIGGRRVIQSLPGEQLPRIC